MSGYVEIDLDQGEDFALQVVWTNNVNEAYQVCHPIRLQARAATGQILLDLHTIDQDEGVPSGGATPTMTYSTDGGVVQIIIPAAQTKSLPSGTLYFDLFVSYKSITSDFVTGQLISTVRLAKLVKGKILVQGRVTSSV